jgi:hypothetical protein
MAFKNKEDEKFWRYLVFATGAIYVVLQIVFGGN